MIKFGEYKYTVGNIDNKKICAVHPVFKKTTKEVVEIFIKEMKKKKQKKKKYLNRALKTKV